MDSYNLEIQAMGVATLERRIPKAIAIDGWDRVSISECGEELASVEELAPNIIIEPAYYKRGIDGSLGVCLVRKTVASMLVRVCHVLPRGWKLLVYDGWRPYAVQLRLFDELIKVVARTYPEASSEKLQEIASKYVSIPSRDESKPSPHATGGAVDLTIVDGDGLPLRMGTEFDDFSHAAHTRFYEEKEENGQRLSSEETVFLRNRRILYNAMTSAGFTNYCYEWWHYDFGDQFWARVRGTNAKYGYVPHA